MTLSKAHGKGVRKESVSLKRTMTLMGVRAHLSAVSQADSLGLGASCEPLLMMQSCHGQAGSLDAQPSLWTVCPKQALLKGFDYIAGAVLVPLDLTFRHYLNWKN